MTVDKTESKKCKDCSHKRIVSNIEQMADVGNSLLIGKEVICTNSESEHFGHIMMDWHPVCECFEPHR